MRWAAVKALLRDLGEIARAELVETITARTGRRTVGTKRLGGGCRNMTQRKWAELILHALVLRGIALDLDGLPRRYISREFLTL